MEIDGIHFNKLEVSKMSLDEFKTNYTGKFKTVDILEASKMLGIKEKKTFKPKSRGKKDKEE